jgi:diacylglycerol kinase family enzyme
MPMRDGTVKLVAQCLQQTNIPLGILPAGSANGMAKELEIPENADKALEIVINGAIKKIHLIKINDQLCIHLSDIGFNAFIVKKFDTGKSRGMWGYIKASLKVLWNKPMMLVEIHTDKTFVKRNAAMVVVANATKYGTGALINPHGKLDDNVFEVVVIKKGSSAMCDFYFFRIRLFFASRLCDPSSLFSCQKRVSPIMALITVTAIAEDVYIASNNLILFSSLLQQHQSHFL